MPVLSSRTSRASLALALAGSTALAGVALVPARQAAAGGASGTAHTRAAATMGSAAGTSSGILLGAAARPNRRGQTFGEALTELERLSGRRFALHRSYLRWDSKPISSTVRWDLDTGHLPIVSVSARRGHTPVMWSRIASGAEDKTIVSQADAFRSQGKPIIVAFHHEPEDELGRNGTAAQYVAAFRHYVSVFRARHATNVSFAWIMMAYSFQHDARRAAPFFPGEDYVSYIAADGYNWGKCRRDGWRSFSQVFAGFRQFGARHPSRPLLVAEFGSEEDPKVPTRKAEWFRDATSTLRGWPQVRAISYFNTTMGHSPCQWRVDSSKATLDGWRSLALNPYLQGSGGN